MPGCRHRHLLLYGTSITSSLLLCGTIISSSLLMWLYLKRLAGVPPSTPLPADIMQRVHPFQYPGTATASAAAMHAAAGGGAPSFAPTIEQMHAGVPPGTTLTTFPPNAGPSPTDGFDAEALHAQMAATAQ